MEARSRATSSESQPSSVCSPLTFATNAFSSSGVLVRSARVSVSHFPSDDGASHVYNAIVMRDYNRPDRAIFREYYVRNSSPNPNWFSHLALAVLSSVFSPSIAEKILVSGYVVLFPFAVRYALGAISPANRWLAVLSLPFVYNFLFQKGFYNFSYSLAVYFLLVGYWLRHNERPNAWNVVGLALLSVLLYFCHLVSVAQAYLLIGLFIIAQVARDVANRRESIFVSLRRNAFMAVVAFVPTLLLAALFLSGQTDPSEDVSITKKILKLVTLYSLVLFDSRERFVAAGLSLFIVAVSSWIFWKKLRRRSLEIIDVLVVTAVVCCALVIIAPDQMAGGGLILDRLVLYPFLVLILWMAGHVYRRFERRAIQTMAIVVTLGLIASRTVSYVRVNSYISEYLSSGDRIAPGSTLLSLTFTDRLRDPEGNMISPRVFPLDHAAGFLGASKALVDLTNYEATTSYFPIQFRPGRELSDRVSRHRNLDAAPEVDFAGYPGRSGGGRVDYVLLWRVRPDQANDPNARDVFRQLAAGYDEIYSSSPRAYAKLYRRKDLSGGASSAESSIGGGK